MLFLVYSLMNCFLIIPFSTNNQTRRIPIATFTEKLCNLKLFKLYSFCSKFQIQIRDLYNTMNSSPLDSFEDVRLRAHNFCHDRSWSKFHLPTSLALALAGMDGIKFTLKS
jgi:hypothetical protein